MKRCTQFAGLASLALAGCGSHRWTVVPAGPQARHIDHVWQFYLAVSIGVFVLVVAAIAYAVRPRATARARDAVVSPDRAMERRVGCGIAVCIALTTLTLFVLLVDSVWAGHAIASLEPREAMTIRVIGHQWWWEVHYADSQPSHEVVTANEIHVPVGRPVHIQLESRDVIHSFWVPALHGKRDAIPGHLAHLVVQADRAGIYPGRCAEFCGLQHANMALSVVAESPAAYARWLAQQNAAARPPADASELHGQQVFVSHPCVMCHTIQGAGASGVAGPDLTHLASRRSLAAGTVPNTRGWLAGWILDPQSIKPGALMPPHALDADELQDLLAYLGSLQ